MAKLYVFGIGGTGSRVLRSLTMLLAAGADANGYDIVPIVIDPDHANGNLTQTISLMDDYVSIRSKLTFAGSNSNRFFSTKIERILTNFTMPVKKTNNMSFQDFIGLTDMEEANEAMARMLFSDENLKSDMKVGFEGNPNIGSVVLNQITKSKDFLQFAQSFQPDDKIFIISSIFGGTGASGFPLLLKTMRNDKNLPNHAAINSAVIGAITVLPYFKLKKDDKSSIDSASFISKSKSALAYYDRTIASNNEVNALYFIGDAVGKTYDNVKGGNKQTNQAHAIELLSATAILDFVQNDYTTQDHKYLELGVKEKEGALTLKSFFGDGLSEMIRNPLVQFALFSLGLEFDKEFLKSKQLAKNTDIGLDDNFYKSAFFKKVCGFLGLYKIWLNEMKSNTISMDLFNMECKNPFEFVTEVKAKQPMFGHLGWNDYRKALNKADTNSSKDEDKFMEMYYNGLKSLCESKFIFN